MIMLCYISHYPTSTYNLSLPPYHPQDMTLSRTILATAETARALALTCTADPAAAAAAATAAQWAAGCPALKDLSGALAVARHAMRREYGQALKKLADVSGDKVRVFTCIALYS
jgi:hypothetical protein